MWSHKIFQAADHQSPAAALRPLEPEHPLCPGYRTEIGSVPWEPELPGALYCAWAAGYTCGPMFAPWPHRWPKDSEDRAANR